MRPNQYARQAIRTTYHAPTDSNEDETRISYLIARNAHNRAAERLDDARRAHDEATLGTPPPQPTDTDKRSPEELAAAYPRWSYYDHQPSTGGATP